MTAQRRARREVAARPCPWCRQRGMPGRGSCERMPCRSRRAYGLGRTPRFRRHPTSAGSSSFSNGHRAVGAPGPLRRVRRTPERTASGRRTARSSATHHPPCPFAEAPIAAVPLRPPAPGSPDSRGKLVWLPLASATRARPAPASGRPQRCARDVPSPRRLPSPKLFGRGPPRPRRCGFPDGTEVRPAPFRPVPAISIRHRTAGRAGGPLGHRTGRLSVCARPGGNGRPVRAVLEAGQPRRGTAEPRVAEEPGPQCPGHSSRPDGTRRPRPTDPRLVHLARCGTARPREPVSERPPPGWRSGPTLVGSGASAEVEPSRSRAPRVAHDSPTARHGSV